MLGKNIPLEEILPQFKDMPFIPLKGSLMGVVTWDFSTLGTTHVDTLFLAWAVMAFILLGAAVVVPSLTAKGPGNKGQALLEMIYDFVADLTKGQIGHDWRKFFPLIAAIFMFVLIANFSGVVPWHVLGKFIPGWPQEEMHGHMGPAEIAAPTTDFNVTFGLAMVALITYIACGFIWHKAAYLKLYLNPIEWLDLVIRPATLSLRLMMVITADELMRGAALMMVPMLLPAGVMGFEMFIGVIQAFVFALLTSIYIGLTVSHH